MRVGGVCNRVGEVTETVFEISSSVEAEEAAGDSAIRGCVPLLPPLGVVIGMFQIIT